MPVSSQAESLVSGRTKVIGGALALATLYRTFLSNKLSRTTERLQKTRTITDQRKQVLAKDVAALEKRIKVMKWISRFGVALGGLSLYGDLQRNKTVAMAEKDQMQNGHQTELARIQEAHQAAFAQKQRELDADRGAHQAALAQIQGAHQAELAVRDAERRAAIGREAGLQKQLQDAAGVSHDLKGQVAQLRGELDTSQKAAASWVTENVDLSLECKVLRGQMCQLQEELKQRQRDAANAQRRAIGALYEITDWRERTESVQALLKELGSYDTETDTDLYAQLEGIRKSENPQSRLQAIVENMYRNFSSIMGVVSRFEKKVSGVKENLSLYGKDFWHMFACNKVTLGDLRHLLSEEHFFEGRVFDCPDAVQVFDRRPENYRGICVHKIDPDIIVLSYAYANNREPIQFLDRNDFITAYAKKNGGDRREGLFNSGNVRFFELCVRRVHSCAREGQAFYPYHNEVNYKDVYDEMMRGYPGVASAMEAVAPAESRMGAGIGAGGGPTSVAPAISGDSGTAGAPATVGDASIPGGEPSGAGGGSGEEP